MQYVSQIDLVEYVMLLNPKRSNCEKHDRRCWVS